VRDRCIVVFVPGFDVAVFLAEICLSGFWQLFLWLLAVAVEDG